MAPHILIVGAGIAGLTLAIACRRAGFRVTVFEQATQVMGLGGGILLYPYGVRVLSRLGLGDRIASLDVRVSGYQARGLNNDLLLSDTLDEFNKAMGYPIIPILRADLLDVLTRELPQESLRFRARITEICSDDHRARIYLSDGGSVEGDLIVGADGIHSQVRKYVGKARREYTGITFWGGVLTGRECLPLPERTMRWWFGKGRTCLLWPLPGERQWWYIMIRLPENQVDKAAPNKYEQLRNLCSGWSSEIDHILSAPQNSHSFVEPIWEVLPMERWSKGRVVIIGDAAHALGPTSGQGANLAIEDAFALACCLKAYRTDFNYALIRYEEIRRPTVEYIREFETTSSAMRVSSDPLLISRREEILRGSSVFELLKPLEVVSREAAFNGVKEYIQ